MDKLKILLTDIEQQFGFPIVITERDTANARELSIGSLNESRERIQEQIDQALSYAFIALKGQIAVIQPLLRMQEQIDIEIARLQALPAPPAFSEARHGKG